MHRLWLAGKLEGKRDVFGCMGREPLHPRTIVIDTEETNHQNALPLKDALWAPGNSVQGAIDEEDDGDEDKPVEEDETQLKVNSVAASSN